jgi:transposase
VWASSRRSAPHADDARKLHGDKSYDYNRLLRWLRSRGVASRIERKGGDSSQRTGRHRWSVERTMVWLAGCRGFCTAAIDANRNLNASTNIAHTLICHLRLAN